MCCNGAVTIRNLAARVGLRGRVSTIDNVRDCDTPLLDPLQLIDKIGYDIDQLSEFRAALITNAVTGKIHV